MRVLIVAPNISMRMGGEAVLPYHYIRELRQKGVEVIALTHARVRDELLESEIWENGAFHFLEDAVSERMLHQIGRRTPAAIEDTVFNSAVGAVTLRRLATRARELCRDLNIDIVHQPTPVSPRFPSFLNAMPAPVVIGPLNGGMSYPPAFEKAYARGSKLAVSGARALSGMANGIAPGKLSAARILVANERTRRALPGKIDRARVQMIVENGVDLNRWTPIDVHRSETPTFVFVGRLVWWKAVDLLIEAFAKVNSAARLVIIGDGDERETLEQLAQSVSAGGKTIEFLGFLPQTEIRDMVAASTALVLPSMREAGGAVILEAFACGVPVIATDWGGPQDYVTPETGILIPPDSRQGFVDGLAAAMERFAEEPQRAYAMGMRARQRVEEKFSWRAKARKMLAIYESAKAHK